MNVLEAITSVYISKLEQLAEEMDGILSIIAFDKWEGVYAKRRIRKIRKKYGNFVDQIIPSPRIGFGVAIYNISMAFYELYDIEESLKDKKYATELAEETLGEYLIWPDPFDLDEEEQEHFRKVLNGEF